ncbi:hypothetical protein HOI18_00745 [Candidatus Uhrbacteria bacterium]|nr:hypothetical protein [Candidatus Uhrbacteria bacterium]
MGTLIGRSTRRDLAEYALLLLVFGALFPSIGGCLIMAVLLGPVMAYDHVVPADSGLLNKLGRRVLVGIAITMVSGTILFGGHALTTLV